MNYRIKVSGKGVIVGVRNIRGEMNIPPGRELTLILGNGDEQDKSRLDQNAPFLRKLAKLKEITWLSAGDEAPAAATALVGELEILVPMAGLIDKDDELARLAREMEKLEKELSRIQGKLSNSAFVDKAPAAVVAKERDKMQAQRQSLEKLQEQERRIRQM